MIVATPFGLYMPALRPDFQHCIASGEPELQVRARRRVDLDRLRKFMAERGLQLGETIALPHTDYQFRAYCTRTAWGQALAAIAEDIDYIKFKDTPAKYHGDNKLAAAYSRMWSAIFNAFPAGSVYDNPAPPARTKRGKRGRGQGGDDLWAGFNVNGL